MSDVATPEDVVAAIAQSSDPSNFDIRQKMSEVLEQGFSESVVASLKKKVGDIIYDIETDIEYRLKEDMAWHLACWVGEMANKAVEALLRGDFDMMRNYPVLCSSEHQIPPATGARGSPHRERVVSALAVRFRAIIAGCFPNLPVERRARGGAFGLERTPLFPSLPSVNHRRVCSPRFGSPRADDSPGRGAIPGWWASLIVLRRFNRLKGFP